MSLDHPPIPMSVDTEIPFPSQVHEHIAYILKPYDRKAVSYTILVQRLIAAKRRPLTEQMYQMILTTDLSPWLSAADISRSYETINALTANAEGIPAEDTIFINQVVEPIMIEQFPEYARLAEADGALAYERRLHDLAVLLHGVEEKGDRYTFPDGDYKKRYEYIRDYVDTLDANLMYIESRNMGKMSADATKNSAPPSTSD